jgi:uncharacterized protein (UPF0262 family)
MQVLAAISLAESVPLTLPLRAVLDDLRHNADLVLDNDLAPYTLRVGYAEGSVFLNVTGREGREGEFVVSLRALRGILRDYLRISDSFQAAIASGDRQRFEAIDLGKKALHDEAAHLLAEMLAPRLRLGHGTARKLFTLICALQPTGKTLLE